MAKKTKNSAPEKSVKKTNTKKTDTKAAKKSEKDKKGGSRIKKYFKDLHAETKKIQWSKWKDVWKNALVVLLVVLVVGIGVWVADALLVKLREVIYNASVKDAETALIAVKAMIGLWV